MAITKTRFLHTNLVASAASVLSASSAQIGNPVAWLKDPLRSKTWRSAIGWTIVAQFNDTIKFNRGGNKTATVAPGTYVVAADLCAAIVVALEAADPGQAWACTYSIVTFKFTISATPAFILSFGSISSLTMIARDIGFPEADTGSATSQVATLASYQSRHFVAANVGFGNGPTALGAYAALGGLSASAILTQQGNTSDIWTAAVVFTLILNGDVSIRIGYLDGSNLQYWRLIIDDVQNPAGYAELGVWFIGTYSEPSVTYAVGWKKRWNELSAATLGTHGALWQDQRPRLREYSLAWTEILDADRVKIEAAAAACPRGKPLFLALDALVTDTNTVYGYFADGLVIEGANTVYFNTALVFAEAGG